MQIDKSRLGKVLAVYASAAFVVLQVVDMFQERLDLPPWIFGAALVLLVVGLPIIVTTSLVQTHDFKSQLVERHFTWSRSIGGGILAFVTLIIAAGFYARDRFGGNDELDANLVAVFPFRVSGADPSLHYLADHAEAARHYTTALDADSTFALSALGMIVVQGWGVNLGPGNPARARRLAWRTGGVDGGTVSLPVSSPRHEIRPTLDDH